MLGNDVIDLARSRHVAGRVPPALRPPACSRLPSAPGVIAAQPTTGPDPLGVPGPPKGVAYKSQRGAQQPHDRTSLRFVSTSCLAGGSGTVRRGAWHGRRFRADASGLRRDAGSRHPR